ncbi:ABC transporter ATP-binding protein [Leptospira ognonensis]|uniref:ABC transporter ATP-binding protein n=1 Tax=Leptospira ognonensis TaxID=2484945 RepID=A0A4R9JY25_9LEPT|nr:ATP-binding cassette domain-containing protein [Leptospira ognonensis]TGL56397.1 ABC transporter ATP-binding protein [Leptospira ognonensis]
MKLNHLKFNRVDFSYSPTEDNLLNSLEMHFAPGWTGIIGPNGIGKSTIAKLATGFLSPTKGQITGLTPTNAFYCTQENDQIPDDAEEFLYCADSKSGELCSLLKIENNWLDIWDHLSYGEKKRLQVGIALWKEHDILVLDEPTNHLDLFAKNLLLHSLKYHKGIGILISHDRDFLNALCSACIFMKTGSVSYRIGNYDSAIIQEELEETRKAKDYDIKRKKYKTASENTKQLAEKMNKHKDHLSKRHIDKHDHDKKAKIDLARISGKDKIGARKLKQLQLKTERIKLETDRYYFQKQKIGGFQFQGEKLLRDTILLAPAQTFFLNTNRSLNLPDLILTPDDKIGITGDNGAGKTSLVLKLYKQLSLSHHQILYIPQETHSQDWNQVESKIQLLSSKKRGELFSIVDRLGSDPNRIFHSHSPSSGEKRKLMFGLGLLENPSIIIMDEPTNHLDLPSIHCLEKALNEFEGCLLVVSHDSSFVQNTTKTRWHIEMTDGISELVQR